MKTAIHPKYTNNITVTCDSCSTTFLSGSTVDGIRVEICSNCHPFYTGKAKIVDTENLVKKFEERKKQVDATKVFAKKQKVISRNTKTNEIKAGSALTLKDMLQQLG